MLDEKKFIDDIWKRYEDYSNNKRKDKFFNKHFYRNTDYILGVRTFATFLLSMVLTMAILGGVYATIKNYNNNFNQKESTVNNAVGHQDYLFDMSYSKNSNIYYKKITTYDAYLESQKIWDDLIEMTQDDFNKNFVLVLNSTNIDRVGLYILNVSSDSSTLKIDVDKKEENDNSVVSAKIPLDLDRDNIEINFIEKIPDMVGYEKMDNLPKEYEKEQALKDNCVVIDNNKFISDENKLKEFITKTESGNMDSIRVTTYIDSKLQQVCDIEYKDGKYIVCVDTSRQEGTAKDRYYYVGNKFTVNEFKSSNVNTETYNVIKDEVVRIDEIEETVRHIDTYNKFIICIIDKNN